MALRILGIDLGSSSVKVVEVRSSFRTVEVAGFWRAEVRSVGTTPTLAEQTAALATLLPTIGRSDVVVVALPGNSSATHRISFPFSETRRLEQTLGFEVEGQIPFDLAEVVYDYDIVSQITAKRKVAARTDVLVGVARKSAVSDLVAALGPLGVDPRIVTLPGLGLNVPSRDSKDAEGSEAILDVGHSRVTLLVRANGRPVFSRTTDGGGRTLTGALMRARGMDAASAEAFKEQASLRAGDPEVQQALTRVLLPTIREVRQSLKQVETLSQTPVTRLWVTGGSSPLDGLPELLERELSVTTALLPPPVLPGIELNPSDSRQASLALGLALRGHGTGRGSRFNFRRGDQSFQGDFARIRARLMQAASLAVLLALCFAVRAYAEIYLLGKREKQVDDAICAQTKQVIGKCIKDPLVAKSVLAGGGAPGETVIPDQSAVSILAEATTRLDVDSATVNEIDIGLEQIQLRGTADNFETVDQLVAALKGYKCFTDVQRGRTQKSRDGSEIEFSLSARNECSALGGP